MMQKTSFCAPAPMRFKRFANKGYALFACLGREVLVGTLSVATLSHARAEGISIHTENAQDSLMRTELKLDEVVITGSRAPLSQLEAAKIVSVITRDDIQRAAAASINDILKLAPGVDVRQRGGFGVQTDISVRGGNFDQITILLNGIPISSPHTGHLSADFPVSPEDIERIEILEGSAARVYGAQAFNGAINIVTRNKSSYVHASGGEYGYVNANGAMSLAPKLDNGATIHALSAGYTRTDGATPNSDFTSSRAFYQGGYVGKSPFSSSANSLTVNGQVGYSYKPYAANTFYGASSTDQWECNERMMAAINADILVGSVHVSPVAYWNHWNDHYQWHKDNPAGENFHKVDNYGGGINIWLESAFGKTSFGADVKYDKIRSSKLGLPYEGDDVYKYRDGRTTTSAFAEHSVILDKWTFTAGVLASHYSALEDSWNVAPGIDIAYRPTDNWRILANWNTALRLPTFTDLYYSGANIEGNSNLKPEKTSDFQIGARYTRNGYVADIQLFYSHKTDMIDWVTYRTTDHNGNTTCDDIYHSVNFLMNNYGAELNLTFLPREVVSKDCPLRSLSLKYSYIHEDSEYDVDVVQSKYAMDFLRNKVVIAADGTLWRKLNLGVSWRWQERTGKGNPPYSLLDARLSWDEQRWQVYVDGTNILNKHYTDYSFIPQPGRWLRAGVVVKF